MATYELSGMQLTIAGPLGGDDVERLHEHFIALQAVDAPVVTIDMREVNLIVSRCVGLIATLWIDLSLTGRRFELIPSKKVKWALDLGGLSNVFGIPQL
jgi:hypothetical protein